MKTVTNQHKGLLKTVSLTLPSLLIIETAVACVFGTTSVTGTGGGRTAQAVNNGDGTGYTSAAYSGTSTIIEKITSGGAACGQSNVLDAYALFTATSGSTSSGEVNCGCWTWVSSLLNAQDTTAKGEIQR